MNTCYYYQDLLPGPVHPPAKGGFGPTSGIYLLVSLRTAGFYPESTITCPVNRANRSGIASTA